MVAPWRYLISAFAVAAVVGIELLADPETLGALELAPVPSGPKQFFEIPSSVEREVSDRYAEPGCLELEVPRASQNCLGRC